MLSLSGITRAKIGERTPPELQVKLVAGGAVAGLGDDSVALEVQSRPCAAGRRPAGCGGRHR